ncbi:hypothetical protein TI39_contig455g00011 [Zymoseptoria brevis]|uniref:Apple domain-containing protein n=1 Tax=Zymoseptoria brevis TaxID=1047168 RepID=A0A0F4GKD4_9PEZI|nr:hypothetical protein TI39_contig455g00011 [Zymoseptoria brevis]
MIYGSIASAYSYCIGARLLYPRPQDGKGDGYGVFVDSVDDCASRCTGACKAFNYDGAYGDSDKKFCEVMPTWTGASPSQPGSYYKTAYALRSTSTVTITSATIGATTGVGLTITATSGPATSARIPAGSSTTRTASSTSRSTTIQTVTSAATTQTSGLGCAVPSVTTFTENGIASTYDYCEGARLENDGPRDGFAQNLNDCAVRCTGGCKAFNYEPTYGDTDDWPRCQLVSTWSAVFPSQTGDYYRTAYSLRKQRKQCDDRLVDSYASNHSLNLRNILDCLLNGPMSNAYQDRGYYQQYRYGRPLHHYTDDHNIRKHNTDNHNSGTKYIDNPADDLPISHLLKHDHIYRFK